MLMPAKLEEAFIGNVNIPKYDGVSVSTRENIFLWALPVLPSGGSVRKSSHVWILTLNSNRLKLRALIVWAVPMES